MSTDLRNAQRLIIRGDGSFNADPKGDWVSARHFDEALAEIERLRGELLFIGGYLLEHRQMLKDNGAHPKIIDAVLWLEKRLATLTALRVSTEEQP